MHITIIKIRSNARVLEILYLQLANVRIFVTIFDYEID